MNPVRLLQSSTAATLGRCAAAFTLGRRSDRADTGGRAVDSPIAASAICDGMRRDARLAGRNNRDIRAIVSTGTRASPSDWLREPRSVAAMGRIALAFLAQRMEANRRSGMARAVLDFGRADFPSARTCKLACSASTSQQRSLSRCRLVAGARGAARIATEADTSGGAAGILFRGSTSGDRLSEAGDSGAGGG